MKTSLFAILSVVQAAAVFLGAAASDFSVDAADLSAAAAAGRSPPSQSLLAKSKSFLSNIMPVSQVSHLQGHGDEISRSRDDLKKPTNLASFVTVKKDFFSKEETAQIRLNENKYQRMPAVGFSGNRIWGGAYVPKSLLRRLVEEGGEQCPSEEYESNLPSGVHILTNHVTETTDPHTDYNPTTLESIENDVAIVFLNTNPDATLLVNGEYAADVEEGTLVMFPGGSVFHHIEIKEGKDGGFVHMFGPLEVGGSHGTVGQIGRNLISNEGWVDIYLADGGATHTQLSATFGTDDASGGYWRRRMLELEGSDMSSSTNQQYGSNNITGEIVVTGFTDGIDPRGNTNHTLEVAYRFEGLDNLNCSDDKCFHAELKDQPDYCDAVEIGQLENDEPSSAAVEGEGDEGYHIILEILSLLGNVDETGVVKGVKYINIEKPIDHFFDKAVALHHHDGTILDCSIFTEVKSDSEAGASGGGGGGGGAVPSASGAGKSFGAALLTFSVFVSSAAFVLITSL